MKKRNLVVLTFLLVFGMGILGCGNASSSELKQTDDAVLTFGKVLEQLDETELKCGSLTVDATNIYKIMEQQTVKTLEMSSDIRYLWSSEPIGAYKYETYEIKNLKDENYYDPGRDMTIKAEKLLYDFNEMYIEEDVAYIKNRTKWDLVDANPTDLITISEMNDIMLDESLLTEEQLQIACEDENETYKFVIKGTYTQAGTTLKEIMDMNLSKIEGISTDLEWTFTFLIEKDTYYPVSCQISFENEEIDITQKDTDFWDEKYEIHIIYSDLNERDAVIVRDSIKENSVDKR